MNSASRRREALGSPLKTLATSGQSLPFPALRHRHASALRHTSRERNSEPPANPTLPMPVSHRRALIALYTRDVPASPLVAIYLRDPNPRQDSPLSPVLCYTYPSCETGKSALSAQVRSLAANPGRRQRQTKNHQIFARCVRRVWKRINASCVALRAGTICPVRTTIELFVLRLYHLFELSGPMVLEHLIASSASKPTKEIDRWHSR